MAKEKMGVYESELWGCLILKTTLVAYNLHSIHTKVEK